MRLDAPGRRSVRITHRNLDRVFLRAYALDLEALVTSSKDYSIFPQGDDARKIVEGQRPDAAWKADLAKTPDYRDHHTYANLPESLAPGLYLVAASAREDFADAGQQDRSASASSSAISSWSSARAAARPASGTAPDRDCPQRYDLRRGGAEILALSGATGRPLAEVTVDLYAFDWRKGHTKIESKKTDASGRVWFAPSARSGSYFLLAQKGPGHRLRRRLPLSPGTNRAPRDTRARSSTPTGRSIGPGRSSSGRSWPIRGGRTSAG